MFWVDVDLEGHYLTQPSRLEAMLKQGKRTVQRQRERLQDWATEDACSMYTTDSKASRSDPQKRRSACHEVRGTRRVVSGAHKGDGLKQMRRDPQRREGGRLVFNGERVSLL